MDAGAWETVAIVFGGSEQRPQRTGLSRELAARLLSCGECVGSRRRGLGSGAGFLQHSPPSGMQCAATARSRYRGCWMRPKHFGKIPG